MKMKNSSQDSCRLNWMSNFDYSFLFTLDTTNFDDDEDELPQHAARTIELSPKAGWSLSRAGYFILIKKSGRPAKIGTGLAKLTGSYSR